MSWQLLAAAAHSRTLGAVTVAAVAFSAAVAGPHENAHLARRHRHGWTWYRGHVRLWWPRWTPYPATGSLWVERGLRSLRGGRAVPRPAQPVRAADPARGG